jgi:hypothetical protein
MATKERKETQRRRAEGIATKRRKKTQKEGAEETATKDRKGRKRLKRQEELFFATWRLWATF